MSQLLKLLDQNDEDHLPNVWVSGGLGWALQFAELLIPKLQGSIAHVSISGWTTDVATGLLFHDEIRGLCVPVGPNVAAGCGRFFWGKSSDFEFPYRIPKDSIVNSNFCDFDRAGIEAAVSQAVEFFTKAN